MTRLIVPFFTSFYLLRDKKMHFLYCMNYKGYRKYTIVCSNFYYNFAVTKKKERFF